MRALPPVVQIHDEPLSVWHTLCCKLTAQDTLTNHVYESLNCKWLKDHCLSADKILNLFLLNVSYGDGVGGDTTLCT